MNYTNIYNHKADFIRSEQQFSLRDYIKAGRLKSGQYISTSICGFYVGDCTKFHQVSDNDGGFGWSDDSFLDSVVKEVYEPMFTSYSQ